MPRLKPLIFGLCLFCVVAVGVLGVATHFSARPIDRDFANIVAMNATLRVNDHNGDPLSLSYAGDWNAHDVVHLYDVPEFLKTAFLQSEDRRFYQHSGVDWRARMGAVWQNIRHGDSVRGASTITEQVVRMIHPRPRNIWSKWVEGFEAAALERHTSKADIFEFYLNQIPYVSNRRGVIQGARHYFDRDLNTLNKREMMALAVLARAPSAYDLYAYPNRVDGAITRLAAAMMDAGQIDQKTFDRVVQPGFQLTRPALPTEARHFARYVRTRPEFGVDAGGMRTTLNSVTQTMVQDIVDDRLRALAQKNVRNAGAIVVDHTNGAILAWVVGGARNAQTPGGEIDPILTPRQPGSSMKPFLYAQAMDMGWNAAHILNDAPLAEAIGTGLHNFRNYSNVFYGPVTLREALGNSLNIPALLTINFVSPPRYMEVLQNLGFDSLTELSNIYDEGLALGVGEVTLYELVRAYQTLARRGVYGDLNIATDQTEPPIQRRIYTDETATLIGHILSDPNARRMEFGTDSVLNLPIQTAAKTGTSTDYRDAWVVGYNDRYIVGIWMGNLDRAPMNNVTGASGPALAMRSIFSKLNAGRDDAGALPFSPNLTPADVCVRPVNDAGECVMRTEWFPPGSVPDMTRHKKTRNNAHELVRPTDGLQMAVDPRIPAEHQQFRFEMAGVQPGERVEYILNGIALDGSDTGTILWPVARGSYALQPIIHAADGTEKRLDMVHFIVK